MPGGAEFQYLILRVVPSLERGEQINAGVVVFCQQRDYLAARVELDRGRLAALAPDLEPEEVDSALQALAAIAAGAPAAGPLSAMTASERFGWLASPSSTVIQPSAVHTGLSDDPAATLDRLFAQLVA
ncbi:MAG: DUF3037 domain-containing protein [Chloroflexota bacterium]